MDNGELAIAKVRIIQNYVENKLTTIGLRKVLSDNMETRSDR